MPLNVNMELLIDAIHRRPTIWDRTSEEYRHKAFTKSAWIEVLQEIDPLFESRPKETQNAISKDMKKKWNNIRDNYVKACKRKREHGDTTQREYVYHRLLHFLSESEGDYGAGDRLDIPQETFRPYVDSESYLDSNSDSYYKSIAKILKVEEDPNQDIGPGDNRNLSFFKGVLPSIQNFNEDENIEFQMGVLQLIYNIRNKRKNSDNV